MSGSCWARTALAMLSVFSANTGICAPVYADDDHVPVKQHCSVDWGRLNLNPQQTSQIQTLEQDWAHKYNDLHPVIVEDQQKLQKMLADHSSDPVEVMSLQQTIARKREQLNGMATANYLKKRQLLNETQQFTLEQMIKDAVRKKQSAMFPGSGGDIAGDRIQNLMNRVRNIWPAQSSR